MSRPLIAVVGNAQYCRDPQRAKQAASELGAELARRNCRILVFSSSQQFIEWDLVTGYLHAKGRREPRSIEVRYPPALDGKFPGEKPADPVFVRIQQSGNWEASIYPAFAELDGLVLIGGAYTTQIYGLLAIGARTPMITLGGLGGAAYEVWESLHKSKNNFLAEDDFNLMAARDWHQRSAQQFADSLFSQIQRKIQSAAESVLSESATHRRHTLTLLAILGSGLFMAVLLALVASLNPELPLLTRCLLFGAPAIAGTSGAAIRVLWDNWQQRDVPLELRPVVMTVALGFWASGVAGVLFVLPQLWVQGAMTAMQANKLSGFAVPIGLIAGLTLDRIFPKLIRIEVPLDTTLSRKNSTTRQNIA